MFASQKLQSSPSIRNGIEYLPESAATSSILRKCQKRMALYLILEAMILLGAFAGYTAWTSTQPAHTIERSGIGYHTLANYNTIKYFSEDTDMMRKTSEAEKFWMDLLKTDGVVSVPTRWALDQGFASSLENPDRPGHSVYQVDMYHSLHCLHHIRLRLVSHVPLSRWPRDDKHTLHCINYIRQQIMCHADITLGSTMDVLHYDLNNGHQCRNYAAVVNWTMRHQWKGHKQWIERIYGYTAGARSSGG